MPRLIIFVLFFGSSVGFSEIIEPPKMNCEGKTASPKPAGGCSTGLNYCEYPAVECHSFQNTSTLPVPIVYFRAHFQCDPVGTACPPPAECATRPLSEKVKAALQVAGTPTNPARSEGIAR